MRFISFLSICTLLLAGCGGGSSGENGSNPFDDGATTPTTSALAVVALDSNCNAVSEAIFDNDATICFQATLTTNGDADGGEIINFSLSNTVGQLAATSAITNNNGVAEVRVSNSDGSAGANSLTATFGETTASANFEYLASTSTTPVTTISLALLDSNCQAVTNVSFTADESICVQATLSTDGTPQAGEIVTFSSLSSIGQLSASNALTNNSGVAEVTISNPQLTTGANTITAAFGTATDSASYEYVAGAGTSGTTTLTVGVLDANCLPLTNPSFPADQSICVQAVVLDNNEPVVGEIVNFSLGTPTTGQLTASSALTDGTGLAQVFINNPAQTIGASSVSATFGDLSNSANYEYVAATPSTDALAVTVEVLDGQCNTVSQPSFPTSATICVRATVTNDGTAVAGELIDFATSAAIGELSASTALTNNNGVAETSITNTAQTLGATSVTATFGGVTGSANYEYRATSSSNASISLSILDSSCQSTSDASFPANQSICVEATLSENAVPQSGEIIDFAISNAIGQLSASNALTNDQGTAQIFINNATQTVGASTLTASFGTASSRENYEYVAASSSDSSVLINVAILEGDCSSSSDQTFEVTENICIQATVTDAGQAVNGEIITFALSSAVGQLSANTALTNANGIAEVQISNNLQTIGAASVTATFGADSGSNNYQYINTPSTPDSTTLSIAVLNADCSTSASRSFAANSNICIRASLTDGTNAIAGELVNFSQGDGIGQLSATSALTNSTGIAETFITNSALNQGATTITANFGSLTATSNYQYTSADNSGGGLGLALSAFTVDSNGDCDAEQNIASFVATDSICIRATLSNEGSAVAGEVVNFSVLNQLGQLSATNALTNSNGVAEITISNPNQDIGATTLTATFSSVSDTLSYEYTAPAPEQNNSPTISLGLFDLNGVISTNTFNAGANSIRLRATVLDAQSNGIQNALIQFSLNQTGPTLEQTTILTDASGLAEVGITAVAANVGAYVATAQVTIDGVVFSDAINIQVNAEDTANTQESEIVLIGLTRDGLFVPNVVGSALQSDPTLPVSISAGATAGFNVTVVRANENIDQSGTIVFSNDGSLTEPVANAVIPLTSTTAVSFSSNCTTDGLATLDATVNTINGVASSTFEDSNCGGGLGNTDQITASIVVNNVTLTATRTISILPEDIGSIEFISANPTEIVLAGTGGQNSQSISTLTFRVNGELGNPLAQQTVNFRLNTSVGNLGLEPVSGTTNSLGQISTRVSAGNVPTSVRVTAEVESADGLTINTQSDLLSVNTGLPDQNSFSFATANFNPEAFDIDGTGVTLTVRLADSFNNPVPNGTTVSFTTEGGQIQPSCITGASTDGTVDPATPNTGTCSVTWTSSNPRPDDHRVTILATAIGHETLFDANGNNTYDNSDGGPVIDSVNSSAGFANITAPSSTGFVDMAEAWRDDNADGVRDATEIFIDYNNNGVYDSADSLFNGPQCSEGSSCGEGEAATIHVRKALQLVMSSSEALWRVYNGSTDDINNIIATNDPSFIAVPLTLSTGQSATLNLVFTDTAGQVMPSGTRAAQTDPDGDIINVLTTVNNAFSFPAGSNGHEVFLTNVNNDAGANDISTSSFVIEAPSGLRTEVNVAITRVP